MCSSRVQRWKKPDFTESLQQSCKHTHFFLESHDRRCSIGVGSFTAMNYYIDSLFCDDANNVKPYSDPIESIVVGSPLGGSPSLQSPKMSKNAYHRRGSTTALPDFQSPRNRQTLSTFEVMKDIQSRFDLLAKTLKGLPLDQHPLKQYEDYEAPLNDAGNNCMQWHSSSDCTCDNENDDIDASTEEYTYETVSDNNRALEENQECLFRDNHTYAEFTYETISEDYDKNSSPSHMIISTRSPLHSRQSAVQRFLKEYNPRVATDRSRKSTSMESPRVSPTGVFEWEYLMETRERIGPSVMQSSRHRTCRVDKRGRPPVLEVSTKPLWKRRLANHQMLRRFAQVSPNRIKEQRELMREIKFMENEFDYQVSKLKAKQRRISRALATTSEVSHF